MVFFGKRLPGRVITTGTGDPSGRCYDGYVFLGLETLEKHPLL